MVIFFILVSINSNLNEQNRILKDQTYILQKIQIQGKN